MKKNPETGNEVNISNFDELHKRCQAIGITYKPSNESITLPALAKLLADAQQAQNAVNLALSDLQKKSKARSAALRSIKPMATRVINALICSNCLPGLVDNMRSILHKIRGTRVNPIIKLDPVVDDPNGKRKNHSVSQQSFVMMMSHVGKMISLLTVIAEYQPNEEDLQLDALKAWAADLEAKDDAVIGSDIGLDSARTLRDIILYHPKNGLVNRAAIVKAYAKTIGEMEYRSVSSIPFRNKDTD